MPCDGHVAWLLFFYLESGGDKLGTAMTQSETQETLPTDEEYAGEDCPAAKRLDEIGRRLEERGYSDVRFSFGGMAKKTRPDIYDAVADALEAILASDALVQDERLPGKGYGLKS